MSQPAEKPRRRRATQRELVLRDARIFERVAAGMTPEEIALKERITPRRVRERLSEIYARQAEQSPAEIAKLQTRRLSEALLVSWSAMSDGNLDAVDRVVRITREMDRYYGFSLRRLATLQMEVADEARPALAPPSEATLNSDLTHWNQATEDAKLRQPADES